MYMKVNDFKQIEKLIEETKDIYIDNAWYLDRFDSECKRCFVIRSNGTYKSAIVFNTVEEFRKWIKG